MEAGVSLRWGKLNPHFVRIAFFAALTGTSSCVDHPRRADQYVNVPALTPKAAYGQMVLGVMLSEKAMQAQRYVDELEGTRRDIPDPIMYIASAFQADFKSTSYIQKIEDAETIGAHLVVVLDISVDEDKYRGAALDAEAVWVSGRGSPVSNSRASAHVYPWSITAVPLPGFNPRRQMVEAAAKEIRQRLHGKLLDDRRLSEFSQKVAAQAGTVATEPQATSVGGTSPLGIPAEQLRLNPGLSRPELAASEQVFGNGDVAVVIGIERYQELPGADYSLDDARLVREYLLALGIRERNIQLLVNERATQSAIKKIVEAWLPNHANSASHVFVYYSGHGAPDPASGEAYIVPYDGDPNYLSTTGYALQTLYDRLGGLPAREVAVVLDACFSGAGGHSVLAKGARDVAWVSETQPLPPNLAVLAATSGRQISTSSPELGHGILTYYFLKAIRDGKKELAEIYGAITPEVEDAAKLLNVAQTPRLIPDASELSGRFRFRR